jgi:hypothetical protein
MNIKRIKFLVFRFVIELGIPPGNFDRVNKIAFVGTKFISEDVFYVFTPSI